MYLQNHLHSAGSRIQVHSLNMYMLAFVENAQGELVKIFAHDSTTNKSVAEAAREAAEAK